MSEVVSVISKINKGFIVQTPALQCVSTLSSSDVVLKKSNSYLFNKCATDLCGSPDKNKSIWVTDQNFIPTASWLLKRKLENQNSTFDKVFDTAIRVKNNELSSIKNYLQNSDTQLDKLDLRNQERLAALMFDSYLEKSINPEADIENRTTIKVTPPKGASEDFIAALNSYADNLKKSIRYNIDSYDFKNAYSDEDLAIITKEAFNKIKETSLKNEAFPSKLKDELKYYETVMSNPDTSSFQYESALRWFKATDEAINKENGSFAFNRAVCSTSQCKTTYSDFFKKTDLKSKISQYENTLNNPSTKQNAITKCKAAIIVAETSKSDSSKVRQIFEEAKDLIIKNMLPQFSEHSRAIMLDYVNNKLEASNKNVLKNSQNFDYVKNFAESSKDYLTGNAMSVELGKTSIIEKIFVLNNSFDEIIPLDNATPCGNGGFPSNAWDAFLPMKLAHQLATGSLKENIQGLGVNDHVFISDFSCQHADHGRHNTTHEIAHALNYLFATTTLSPESTAFYNNIRSCVVSAYPNAIKSEGIRSHKGDRLYTEEDAADVFAFMANQKEKKIYSCEFLKPSLVNNSYADLTFISNTQDNHSTGFSRVLFEAVNKDISLPESCQQLIEEEKPDMRFNKCI